MISDYSKGEAWFWYQVLWHFCNDFISQLYPRVNSVYSAVCEVSEFLGYPNVQISEHLGYQKQTFQGIFLGTFQGIKIFWILECLGYPKVKGIIMFMGFQMFRMSRALACLGCQNQIFLGYQKVLDRFRVLQC